MALDTPRGASVEFIGKNGTDHELKAAMAVLTVGDIYTVRRVEVGDWSSKVYLTGYDTPFNTVHFCNIWDENW
jgi:hypothetical protein